MNPTVNPNDAVRAWTSRNDAVTAIAAIIAEADGGLDGPVEEAYDLEGIADEALVTQGGGYLYRFVVGVDDDAFWAIVARHIR